MKRIPALLSHPHAQWAFGTLLLAPTALYVYIFFEWLFLTTTASPVAALPLAVRLEALVMAPRPFLVPLVFAQVVFTVLSTAHRRARFLAVIPAAVLIGMLLFILVDNFTYTVFGFGVLKSGPSARVAYTALLAVLMVGAGWKIFASLRSLQPRGSSISLAGILVSVLILALAPTRPEATPLSESMDVSTRAARGSTVSTPAGGPGPLDGSHLSNVLLIGCDGLDSPYLSVYEYERETTPYLRQLADESLVFENAFANVGRTHGSLVSLLTGRLPTSTRVIFPPTILQGPDSRRHLPALLKERGYRTLQLGMRHYADAEDANMRGAFDAANYRWEDLLAERSADGDDEARIFRVALVERAEQRVLHALGIREFVDGFAHVKGKQADPYWSDERRVGTLLQYFREAPEPWLVHVHLLDSHCCDQKPDVDYFGKGTGSKRDTRDNAIREADGHVQKLVEALRRTGQLDRTIVVISSDHTSAWGTTGRVPLLIRFPNGERAGRVNANVQLADVAPTVLDYLNLPVPPWMDGRSLLLPMDAERPIFALSDIVGRKAVAPRLSEVSDARPPNYGAATATIILGDSWFELNLTDGSMTSGRVEGHVGGSARRSSVEEARTLLTAHLESNGFRIGRGEDGRSKGSASPTAVAPDR